MTHAATVPQRVPVAIRIPAVAGLVGRTLLAGVDGVLVGLTIGYLALTAIGAPANAVGLPWPLAIAVVGVIVTAVAAAGAAVAVGVVRLVAAAGRRLDARVRPNHPRVAGVVALPFRAIAALPAAWIGAFGVLLWIAVIGRTMGPLGLLTPPGVLSTFVYAAGVVAGIGAMARSLLRPARPGTAPGRIARSGAAVLSVLAVTVAVATVGYAAWPGTTDGLVRYDPAFDGIVEGGTLPWLSLPDDPGSPGPFAVDHLSYGSGTDARRPAFGAEADLVTPTVDAAVLLPPLDGGADDVRAWWWGFGTDALPLGGLVWAPRGDGPFPLVLIVHGNHAMGEFSEPGYAYLGEHLASRGFITVSVDEDFLNGSWAGDWGGSEQLVRAWLLLLHIDQWRSWASDPASPFHGRVDLERVALIGHSRGGEAASVAASMTGREQAPRGGMDPWPTGLDVDAVVSIAPSDGQYAAAVALKGVDFLTLQGGYDADARAWSGIRQYARTTPDDDGFKAAFWSYRSNHGQFNTVWGRSDHGPFGGTQLNLAPVLEPADQEDVARTVIGAFLEASLHDRDAYEGMFARPMAGREWLPEDIYLVRSASTPDVQLTAGGPDRPVPGATIASDGFTAVGAMHVPLRAIQSDQSARAVIARWGAVGGDATWGVDGIDRVTVATTATSELRFALADGSATDGEPAPPLAIAVEAVAVDGTTVRLPLERFGALPPPLPVRLAKHDALMATSAIDLSLRSPAERVLQTYAIPLGAFEAASPAFRAEALSGFRIVVGREAAGALWIADVAVRP